MIYIVNTFLFTAYKQTATQFTHGYSETAAVKEVHADSAVKIYVIIYIICCYIVQVCFYLLGYYTFSLSNVKTSSLSYKLTCDNVLLPVTCF